MAVALTALLSFASETEAFRRNLQKGAPLGTPLEWPGLRFQFTIKQSAKNVFGQSDISMYANPVVSNNNAKVLYDVYATFTENNTLHNYTLVDSVAYIEDTPFSSGSGSSPRDQVHRLRVRCSTRGQRHRGGDQRREERFYPIGSQRHGRPHRLLRRQLVQDAGQQGRVHSVRQRTRGLHDEEQRHGHLRALPGESD